MICVPSFCSYHMAALSVCVCVCVCGNPVIYNGMAVRNYSYISLGFLVDTDVNFDLDLCSMTKHQIY